MEPTIKPKFGRVLIKREVKEITTGGIIMPGNTAKRHAPCEGIILALGETAGWSQTYNDDGETVMRQIFKVGDKVIFGQHAGAWLNATKEDDGTLFICADEDILAIKEAA